MILINLGEPWFSAVKPVVLLLFVGPGYESKRRPTYPMTNCLNINQATTLLNKSCSMFLPRWIYDDLEGQVSISNSLALQARGWAYRAHTCPSLPTQWRALYCASSPFHLFCGALCLHPPGPWVNTWKMGPKDGSSPINQLGMFGQKNLGSLALWIMT